MSLLESRLQTKAERRISIPPITGGTQLQLINGRLVTISDNQQNYIDKGYSINDIIYSIINLITDKIKVAPWSLYTIKDETAMKSYQAMQRKGVYMADDFRKIRDLRHKAIEPVKDPGKIGELLKWPNPDETFTDFVGNGCAYKLILGNKYMHGDLLSAGANKGIPNTIRNLPAQWIIIKANGLYPITVLQYIMNIWDGRAFDANEVLHEKMFNPNFGINGQQLYGMAPMKAALQPLNRDNSSLDASTAAFQNEGINGILHMKADAATANGNNVLENVRSLKKTMVTEWVGENNRGKMGISGYDIGWIPIGLTAKEMQQIENEKWNLRRLCSVWGVQSQLLNDPDNKTFANVEDAEKALTVRCAIPRLNETRDNLNHKFQTDWGLKGRGQIIDYDQSVFTELQQDSVATAKWLQVLMDKGFPLNRALEIMNLERVQDLLFDEPWVTQAMGQPLSEWSANPVDNALMVNDES